MIIYVRTIGTFLLIFLLLLHAQACSLGWTTAGDASGDGPADVIDSDDGSDVADTSSDCPPGLTECGGECVNTDANHSHCGTCDNECEPFEVCSDGGCRLECPPGTIACDGACADIDADIMNCGGCGIICSAGLNADPVCESRVCTIRCHEGWSDLDGDGACETECVPTSASETCNGLDDNCDGAVDEGFDCAMGRTVSCTTACGSLGTGLCGIDCTIPGPSSCNPPAELCNAIDDDCDDVCDNGFDCCRGQSKECETSCGTVGTKVCSATCSWSACRAGTEICNGEDDDCSGECDDGEGMACCMGEDGEGMACCMGEDGDCTTSCGSTGSRECTSSCVWDSCEPPDETCNGEDDDCDGTCDNGFTCCRGEDGDCTTSCGSTGSRTCSSSCSWGSCEEPDETCNGIDDDCDDDIDEGFRAENRSSTYTTLSGFNPECSTSGGETDGWNCNNAIHHYCRTLGCPQSGFGPTERTGDNLSLTCVAGGEVIETTFTVLSGHHETCNTTDMRCWAAVNRFCRDRGYVSGFGPVEISGSRVKVTCLTGAVRIATTYTELSTHHEACDGGAGSRCYAATKRFCRSEGHTSGFGPVERSGDNCTVVCVFP